jgi:hypothetical protein
LMEVRSSMNSAIASSATTTRCSRIWPTSPGTFPADERRLLRPIR